MLSVGDTTGAAHREWFGEGFCVGVEVFMGVVFVWIVVFIGVGVVMGVGVVDLFRR